MDYSPAMTEILKTAVYDAWFSGLRDRQARARIELRIDRLVLGNPGDVRPVGKGVSEMRIDYGPGYRIYFAQRGSVLVVLLAGGDKRTQDRDIRNALVLAAKL
jgi:putative addiction module killer protein